MNFWGDKLAEKSGLQLVQGTPATAMLRANIVLLAVGIVATADGFSLGLTGTFGLGRCALTPGGAAFASPGASTFWGRMHRLRITECDGVLGRPLVGATRLSAEKKGVAGATAVLDRFVQGVSNGFADIWEHKVSFPKPWPNP